jgi:hypothetical protein
MRNRLVAPDLALGSQEVEVGDARVIRMKTNDDRRVRTEVPLWVMSAMRKEMHRLPDIREREVRDAFGK